MTYTQPPHQPPIQSQIQPQPIIIAKQQKIQYNSITAVQSSLPPPPPSQSIQKATFQTNTVNNYYNQSGISGFGKKTVAPIASSTIVNNVSNRNVSLSTSKANIVIGGNTVNDNVNRNASAGKISIMGNSNFGSGSVGLNKSASSAKFNISIPPATATNNILGSLSKTAPLPNPSVVQTRQLNSSFQKSTKPNIQFNSQSGSPANLSNFNFSSFSSQPQPKQQLQPPIQPQMQPEPQY